MANSQENGNGTRYIMDVSGWPTERWLAVIVILSLAALILLRSGFRGINVMGASARLG